MLDNPLYKEQTVPITLFGDGVQYIQAGSSLHVLCWSGMLSKGWSWRSVYLLATMPKLSCTSMERHGIDSLVEIWKWVKHGFDALVSGFHPTTDAFGLPWTANTWEAHLAGRPICNGEYRAAVWGIACDLDYAANAYGTRHFNSAMPCHHCKATRDLSPTNVRDYSATAGWRTTLRCPAEKSVSDHPIWNIRAVSAHHFQGDWMHTFDLGLLLHLHASTIVDICQASNNKKLAHHKARATNKRAI